VTVPDRPHDRRGGQEDGGMTESAVILIVGLSLANFG